MGHSQTRKVPFTKNNVLQRCQCCRYGLARTDSFEELKNYWAGQIKESSHENIILVITENKSDLIGHEAVDEGEARNSIRN